MMENVRPGYRQTEVGLIPQDWETLRVSELGSFLKGSGIRKDEANSGDLPCVRYGEIYTDFNDVVRHFRSHVSREVAATAQRLRPGDLLFAGSGETKGEIGKCVALAYEGEAYAGGDIVILRTTDHNPIFLAYLMNLPVVQRQKAGRGQGDAVVHISATALGSIVVSMPSAPEQRLIAEALSDADAWIEGLEQLIAKKRQIKHGAMQALLTGKTRLPGFSGEWAVQGLFEICGGKKEFFDDGDWIESEHITSKGIRLVQTGNIGVGRFIEKDEKKYIFEESFTSLRCKEIIEGDLLICRLAEPAGRACVMPDIGEDKAVTSVDVTIARPAMDTANRIFLANMLSMPDWFRAVSDRSGGTTHKRISRGNLGKIELNLPRLEEQTAIAEILTDMDAEIGALEAKLAKARAIKQGMMQDLLTGKVRLV